MSEVLICTVGGAPHYGTEMEYAAVRMKKGDRVRYRVQVGSGPIKSGVGTFVCSSFGIELGFDVATEGGSHVTVFPCLGDSIERIDTGDPEYVKV